MTDKGQNEREPQKKIVLSESNNQSKTMMKEILGLGGGGMGKQLATFSSHLMVLVNDKIEG